MQLNAFIRLASSIGAISDPATIVFQLLDAIRELEDTLHTLDEKLDRVLREPFTTAMRLTEDAGKARGAYKQQCLTEARLKFITAESFESPVLMKVRAGFCAGVCADLLAQPQIALADYERSYGTCLDEEARWWRRNAPESTWKVAESFSMRLTCSFGSRRQLLANVIAAYRSTLMNALVNNPRNDALNELYPAMRPIASALKARGSKHAALVATAELRTDNYERGAKLSVEHLDAACPKDSHYWQAK